MIKIDRINSELQKQIALIVDNEVKNPLISEGMLTVTRANVTPDLKHAKVYVSIFCPDLDKKQEIFNALKGAGGFIRNKLKGAVKIRLIPELHFVLDDSLDYGEKIESLIKTLNSKENPDG
jgi:ribosome-binding factor A